MTDQQPLPVESTVLRQLPHFDNFGGRYDELCRRWRWYERQHTSSRLGQQCDSGWNLFDSGNDYSKRSVAQNYFVVDGGLAAGHSKFTLTVALTGGEQTTTGYTLFSRFRTSERLRSVN
jgi:hypothetical protein